jgi:hypothetical protein
MNNKLLIISLWFIATLLMDATASAKEAKLTYDPMSTTYATKFHFDYGPKSKIVRIDERMIEAAEIAVLNAYSHSTKRCWRAVKNALVQANVIDTRPTSRYAKQAGDELQNKFGFKKLAVNDPFDAPVGSVLVYGGHGAGHVEIRTLEGFVSDFTTTQPARRPLLGVYVRRV